jgi:hypothetical protein
MDKSCDTCLYGIRAEDNKLGCLYSGICHTPDGEKTAWMPNKAAQYADLKGRRFRPTFSSNIDYFEIRGYDAERDMVLTTAHPKGGSAFDDEIEERYLVGAFEKGEYEAVNDMPVDERTFDIMVRPYFDMMPPVVTRKQKFCGPSCARCHHRFGTTSNAAWCETHWQQSRCYRFKLEKQ